MARRRIAVVLYATAAVAAILDPNYLGLGLATASVLLLAVGYRLKGDLALVASGWLLYLPLAAAFGILLGPFWSYLASGTYLAVVSERLSFENQLSFVLEAPGGVDAESKRLSRELSESHLCGLARVIMLVAIVGFLSLAASFVLSAVSVLILASVMLFIAVGLYARRGAKGQSSSR